MTTIADILEKLDTAVLSGDAARQAIADGDSDAPESRVMLREVGIGVGHIRGVRDCLRAALAAKGRAIL